MSDDVRPEPGLPELRATGEQLAALLTHVDEVIASFGPDGTVLFISPAVKMVLGYEPAAMIGRNVTEFVQPDVVEALLTNWNDWLDRSGAMPEPVYAIRHADGRWVDIAIEAVVGPAIAPFGSGVATLRLAEPTTHVEQALRERLVNEDRLTRLATTFVRLPPERFDDGVADALELLGSLKNVDRVALLRRTDDDELVPSHQWQVSSVDPSLGRSFRLGVDDSHALQELAALREIHIHDVDDLGEIWELDRQRLLALGMRAVLVVPLIERGRMSGCLALTSGRPTQFDEATYLSLLRSAAGILAEAFARHEAELRLSYQAHFDSVTGLGNRWAFHDALADALVRMQEGRAPGLSVLLLDVDRFNVVNDSLGHAAGDELLAQLAQRLRDRAYPEEFVGRFGGDEIVVLFPGTADAVSAGERAADLLSVVGEPCFVDGHEIFVTMSGGIAVADETDVDPNELVRRADAAMYLAKARGRDRVEIFDAGMRETVSQRLRHESELRQASREHQFELHYQPEVDLIGGGVVGAEALVRWRHPERGLLAAGDFIELAEETGAILDIGRWVLTEACRQLAEWNADGLHPLLRVNLSARQVTQPDLVSEVIESIERSGVAPSSLCLEITETALMADAELSLEVLEKLHSLGIQLAIDDFGTGYSSLTYLKRFPVDVVKIDQSFVQGLGHDSDDTAIVRTVLRMAEALGLEVTAEGVETEEQLEQLKALGCRRAQGYLLGRPAAAAVTAERFARTP